MKKRFFWAIVLFLSAGPTALTIQARDAVTEDPTMRLEQAWNSFSKGMQEAQRSLVDPQYFPPPPTARNLAEGYRYMLGHLERMVQLEMRQHPRYPEFHRSMDMLRKWTGENPDTMYLKARIDDSGFYRISGHAADTREWRNPATHINTPKAPRNVIFQTITGAPGATGELDEMRRCVDATLDFIDSMEMQIGIDGHFEILIGPERPENFTGNFLVSRKNIRCAGTGEEAERSANWVSVREVFSDWANEQPLDLDIVRLDAIGESRPPLTAEEMAEKLERIGTELPNQIRFWNRLQEFALELRRDVNGDGQRAMPVNGFNPAEPPFTAGGVAGARQLYAGGKFELSADEALVIRLETPIEPFYLGFQLNTLWFEGPDQQNYVSSLTGDQLPRASDGARWFVIAHEDPGVQGWIATTGLQEGSDCFRFVFHTSPTAEQMPSIKTFHVKLKDIANILPADTPRITPEMRRQEIAIRQAHIKKRWRNY